MFGANDYTNYTMDTGVNSGVLQYVFYFITILLIGLILLVVVNYTLFPIFKTRPGGQGVVALPGSDTSTLFWKDPKDLQILQDMQTPLGSNVSNWSFLLDIQIDNPTSNTNYPRILFTRGALVTAPTQPYKDTDTILTLANNFNVCVWLDRMTNDLFIAVLTTENQENYVETVKIPNLPVRKATRLGCMVGSRVLEVYINGYLIKSKTFTRPLRSATGSLQPPNDTILSSTARVRNLRLWNTPIPSSEFRAYGAASDFDLKELPDSCAT